MPVKSVIENCIKSVTFHYLGDFTIAEIKGQRLTARGVTKRNPNDQYDEMTAKQVAFARALRDLAEQAEQEVADRWRLRAYLQTHGLTFDG